MSADYNIRENSFIAKLAAWKLRSKQVAIVIGRTIHLHKTSKEEFLADSRWLRHELCHIRQFKENGYFAFLVKYLWESLKDGYHNNKYEREARAEEELTN